MVKGEHLRPLLGLAAVASAAALILGTQLTATVEQIVAGPPVATTTPGPGDLVLGQTLQAAPPPRHVARIRTVTPAQASAQRADVVLSSFAPESAGAATQAAPAVVLTATHLARPRAAHHAAASTSSASTAPTATPAPGTPTTPGTTQPTPAPPAQGESTTRPGVVVLAALAPGAGHGIGPGRSTRDGAGPGRQGHGHAYGHTTYAVQATRPHRPAAPDLAVAVTVPTPGDHGHGHAYGHGNGHSGSDQHVHGQPGRTDHTGPGAGERTHGRARGHR